MLLCIRKTAYAEKRINCKAFCQKDSGIALFLNSIIDTNIQSILCHDFGNLSINILIRTIFSKQENRRLGGQKSVDAHIISAVIASGQLVEKMKT